ncbi:hypothetical protein Aspvir_009108 [Aspergillus viridinutans]|uniref:Uncharacterized protein n=1 Tax=Aspergillus viridinutans TaxID=75553 RepID=A0A9P3F4P9_ASPVI|nr:uncharacterized protein Aspvir_009108 [Aspergillus viridinutans]GIK05009.1 hypothetical protein Aspvir_009108 [Aspergillus viridinutans]
MEFDLILWLNTLMKAEFSVQKHTSTTTVTTILDTEVSTSGRYHARLDSVQHARQHHSKKSRVKSRLRRDLQSINDTVLDDRGDSTEDIVSKGEMELGNMAHGVYQETTIEITHEAAEPEEALRKPNRFSRVEK